MSYCQLLVTCAALALSSHVNALSLSAAFRTPANADPTSSQFVGAIDHVVDLNAERSAVTIGAFTSVTSVHVDADRGIVGSYASATLSGPVASNAGGFSSSDGTLAAAGILRGGTGNAPVDVTVSFAFNGSFGGVVGRPDLAFIGTLAAGGSLKSDSFVSQIVFASDESTSGAIETLTTAQRTYTEGEIQYTEDYAGATPTIVSTAASALSGVASLKLSLSPGESLSFAAGLHTSVAGQSSADGLRFETSAGVVDASHTGRLLIIVPQGYSFTSDSQMFTNAVVSVPEPSEAALLMLGLSFICLLRKRFMVTRTSTGAPGLLATG